MGLARRIKAADPSQDVRLYGHLLREVDDYTTADARVIAAVKNIAEGTGTALDAAKILKDAPERIGELPPRSRLVQQAQGLVLLSNKAFGSVINDVIPAKYGAITGRLIPEDEGMQDAAIAVLAKTQPANEFQAESIVRQVMDAGAETRTQETLFGEEVITESYFAERAKVLDQAVKQLRKDKASFANLVKIKNAWRQKATSWHNQQINGEQTMTRKQSGFSKPSQTSKGRSRTPSQQQPAQPEKRAATDELLMDSSKMSDERFKRAISIGSRLAMQDALSMIRRKAARVRQSQSQT